MDLVRRILLAVEEKPSTTAIENLPGFDRETVIYHTRIMIDAGIIDGDYIPVSSQTDPGKGEFIISLISGLSWDGNEFIDATRNQTIWNRTKALLAEKGGGWTFEILKEVATSIVRSGAVGV